MLPYRRLNFAIALAGLLVLGFIATSVISYFVAHESVTTRIADETLPLTSDNIYSEIERDLLRSVLISSLMAHDTFLRDWARDGERDPERAVRYLEQIQTKYETTTAFFVSERSRNYYHSEGVLKQVSEDDPRDAWYFRVRAMNDPYEINLDYDTADRQRLTIFVNYRVMDGAGNYLGATGIGLSVRSVARLIANYQQRYGRQIYFVDREGEVTLRGEDFSGPESLRERPGMQGAATRILANPSSTVSYAHPDGRTVYVNSRLLPELGWYLIVEQSQSRAETRVLNTLVLNIAIALAITALVGVIGWFTIRGYQARLEEMASTDRLTGVANRQVFDLVYDHVAKLSRRTGEPVSMLAVDIDWFKQVNDRYGHAAGDSVLRAVTAVFRDELRESDSVCRWGGDEFIILLGDCALADAQSIGEKIRAAVHDRVIAHGGRDIRVTVSVGVAEQRSGEGLVELAARADEALYRSMEAGRDRVHAG